MWAHISGLSPLVHLFQGSPMTTKDVMNTAQIRHFKRRFLLQYIKEGFRLSNGGGRPYKDSDNFWAWLNSSERKWPFAYLAICDELGIDADKFRYDLYRQKRRLHRLKKQ